MANGEWKWWVGHDDERFHTSCETREEAVYIASEEQEGGYIVEAKQAENIELSAYFDADVFLEQADERAYDDHGDPDSGEATFDASTDQQKDLRKRVRAAIDEWQKAHDLTFRGWRFSASRNEEYIPAATPSA